MKNRIIIAIAALSYLVFYFVSPFFHYHQKDHLLGINQQYHSHLFNNSLKNESKKTAHLSYENQNDHSHKHIINTLIAKCSLRLYEQSPAAIAIALCIDSASVNPSNYTNLFLKFSFSKHKWERCVHTASDISPPSILTS
ncbi:MAG: hypothetical protein AB1394_06955 [Bacteroidota bacterium]